jgi:hypothetical protein
MQNRGHLWPETGMGIQRRAAPEILRGNYEFDRKLYAAMVAGLARSTDRRRISFRRPNESGWIASSAEKSGI